MASHAARHAAYAELVAGLLDVRDESAQERFDIQIERLIADGRLTPDVARSMRLLQRQSVRSVVEHAQLVLPATLLALEQSHRDQWTDEFDEVGDNLEYNNTQDLTELPDELFDDIADDIADDMADDNVEQDRPVDLTARRLLVAGLTMLPDP